MKSAHNIGMVGWMRLPLKRIECGIVLASIVGMVSLGGCVEKAGEAPAAGQVVSVGGETVRLDGRISTETFSSSRLGREWAYNVYTPGGYDASGQRYPVLYLQHGSGGRESSWNDGMLMLDSLIAAGAIPPTLAIAAGSGTSWWVDGVESFESAFVDDLIPEVDSRYRTIANRNGRALAGYSMGGYGALRYALAHSELFGAAILLSPAIYDGAPPDGSSARTSGAFGNPFSLSKWTSLNYPQASASYRAKGLDVPLFIVSGDDDWHHEEGLQYDIEQQATLVYGRLHKEMKLPAELRILNGGHDWAVWGPGFDQGLQYAFGFLSRPLE